MPARAEEVKHAKEEGVEFRMLTNPVEFVGDEKGWLTGARCVRMELGEPDKSGRRSPVVIQGSEFILPIHLAIIGLGTTANPLIQSTTPDLKTDVPQLHLDRPGNHSHLKTRGLCRRRHRNRRRHGDPGHGRGTQGRRVHPRIFVDRRVENCSAKSLNSTEAQNKAPHLSSSVRRFVFCHVSGRRELPARLEDYSTSAGIWTVANFSASEIIASKLTRMPSAQNVSSVGSRPNGCRSSDTLFVAPERSRSR